MTVGIFGPALAYDHASKRGVAGVVCKVLDAVTGIPLDALNLDGSEAPVVTNSQGYVPEFALDPAPLLVIVEAGAIRMPMMNLSMVMDSSQAAIDAVQAAQDAAALVDAPADTVIKTLVEGGSTQTRGALELIFQKLLPLVTATADGIMRKTDKAKLDLAAYTAIPSAIALRNTLGNIRFTNVYLDGETTAVDSAARKGYVDALAVGVTLPNAAHDLNDYVDPGIFLQPANVGAIAGANYPMPYAGKLDVKRYGVITWQTYQGYQAQSRLFWRSKYNSSWSAWSESPDATVVSNNLALVQNSVPSRTGRFSVLDFGAKGNGVTNDAPAIQACVDAATAANAEVYFPGLVYAVGTPIRFPRKLKMFGAPGARWLRLPGSYQMGVNWYAGANPGAYDGNGNIRIEGLTFDADGRAGTIGSNMLTFTHAEDILVEDCRFLRSHTYHALEFNSVAGGVAQGLSFEGWFDGASSGGTKEAIQIDYAGPAVDIGLLDDTMAREILIADCVMKPFGTMKPHGYFVGGHSGAAGKYYESIKVKNNTILGALKSAISPYQWIDALIEGNTIKGAGSAGVLLSSSPGTRVVNNSFQGVGSYFIYSTASTGLMIAANTGTESTGEGITLSNGSSYSTIANNRLDKTDSYAVTVTNASNDSTVNGNLIAGGGKSSTVGSIRISGESHRTAISQNTVRELPGYKAAAPVSVHANSLDTWAFGNDFKGMGAISGTVNTTGNRT